MSNKKRGGFANAIISIIVFVILAGLVLGFFRDKGIYSFADLWDYAISKGPAVKRCLRDGECGVLITDTIDDIKEGSSNHPRHDGRPNSISANEYYDLLQDIRLAPPEDVDYDRTEWKHWDNVDGSSCWNVREEALYRDAVDGTAELLDKEKKRVRNKADACYIVGGEWEDPYSGEIFYESKKLDNDHIVPLSYAARHGGQEWTETEKRLYANDLDNLIIVSAGENRRKGDKGPADYMPKNKNFHCEYAERFIYIIQKYELTITPEDKLALEEALNTCP